MEEKTVLLKDLFEEALKGQWISEKGKRKRNPKRKKLPEEEYNTGFKNVNRVYCQGCRQKFTYQYTYFEKDTGKQKFITSIDFLALKEKVREKDLTWEMNNLYYARKTAKEVGLPLRDLKE